MEKKKITPEDVDKAILASYDKLLSEIYDILKVNAEMKLMTADAVMLIFPDEVTDAGHIEKGTGPVKYEDGRLAVGEFTMPDGTTFTTGNDGIVTKVKHPTPEEIAAKMKSDAAKILADIKAFREELKPYIVRKPFKQSNCK